jgi:hypothetical protein
MPLTNYPNGVASFGLPLIGSGPVLTTGQVFFVNSTTVGASDGNIGDNPDRPLATIQRAVNLCVANRNDHIVVGPGHVETVIAAGGLNLNKAGITLLGIGNKRARPIINFTTAVGASMTVTAANIFMSGFQFRGGIDALTGPIGVQAADFTLYNWTWTDITGEATTVVLTTAAADRMELAFFEYDGAVGAGTGGAIAIVGGDGIQIHDFIADGNFSVGFIDIRTTATTDLKVWNVSSFRTRNAADIFLVDTITASTGTIGPNLNLRLNDNAANITEACTGATFVYFQPINIVNLAGESSMQTNITASTDA